MRTLFEMDLKNYKEDFPITRRPSVRAIIIEENRIAMVHVKKYGYYKFPGGGIKGSETHEKTLIREVSEEAGLHVLPNSIREYGSVLRKEKGEEDSIFLQENFYYFADTERRVFSQNLDDYEDEEDFTLEWVDPSRAIMANESPKLKELSLWHQRMAEREARVLRLLIKEGYFDYPSEMEGTKIILRKAKLKDLNAIYQNIWSDKKLARNMMWSPMEDFSGARERLLRTIRFQEGKAMYFIADKETDEAIGLAGMKKEAEDTWCEAGICVAEKCQKKGIGKEVLGILLDLAFYRYDAEEFAYYLIQGNEPSKRLAESFGFTYDREETEVREWDKKSLVIERYILKKEDYLSIPVICQ